MKQSGIFFDKIQDSNLLTYIQDHRHGAVVVKQYKPKPFNGKMIKYTLLQMLGREIPVEYWSPAQRRDFEKACLDLWHAKGFKAPKMLPVPEGFDFTDPFLGLEPVEGERLDSLLRAPDRPPADKLAVIASVFAEMKARHCIAIFEQEHRLIHYDANVRNLIIAGQQLFHLDFEMGHLEESIDRSAAREVMKLSLQLLNILGSPMLDEVVESLIANYQIHHILRKMIEEVLDRPWQWYHLRRDRKRKKADTHVVTKVDLAIKLKQKMEKNTSRLSAGYYDQELVNAIETSWDGKFYQSLDDSDPRSRDMNHRYAVMGFPDSFKNQSLLDIGCNIGRICVDAKKRGAKRAVGIDNRQDVVTAMNSYFTNTGDDVTLYTFDVNQGVEALKPLIGQEMFDYVCALSIWSHVDQQKLWEIINAYCAKVCLFEDNCPSRVRSLERIESTLKENLNFSSIEFLGFTTDRGVRAVFRLTK